MKHRVIANGYKISLGRDENCLKLTVVIVSHLCKILTKESTRLSLLRLGGQAMLRAHY